MRASALAQTYGVALCGPDIAVIQVPQDYRDGDESLFKRYCEAEYRVFFNIGMVIRNDHDAIIQHGTMTLIRKSVLQRLRWAEWCICEDAELGLRILEHGFSTGYAAISYGKGLMPDTFMDFKNSATAGPMVPCRYSSGMQEVCWREPVPR